MLNNQFSQPKMPDPIFHIEADKIKPNPHQPRRDFNEEALKELASSIREFGILHPLVVTKFEKQTEFGTDVEYQLISGERRLLAAKIAGLERVPAIIKVIPTERERLELAIIENIQRENLNPIETARAYAKLQDQFGLTQREIAVRVGKSREVVANAVRLLNLPSDMQEAVSRNQINESQARLLLMVPDIQEQQALFDDLIRNNLSVRELRSRIQIKKEKIMPRVEAAVDSELSHLEEQIRELLGTKVKLQREGGGAKLIINFYSPEELQALINKLSKPIQTEQNEQDILRAPEEGKEFTI
jgi:ParB family chromosome partitioning protein